MSTLTRRQATVSGPKKRLRARYRVIDTRQASRPSCTILTSESRKTPISGLFPYMFSNLQSNFGKQTTIGMTCWCIDASLMYYVFITASSQVSRYELDATQRLVHE